MTPPSQPHDEVVRALRAAGLAPDRDLLVHSSFRPVKARISGGALIEAVALAVGSRGRLFFPALSYTSVKPENPVFDARSTPSCVGYLAELFRTRFAESRSLHPTHSVCGIGGGVLEVLDAHRLDTTPVGPHSPFSALRRTGGAILMLGCGLEPCTSMHGVEEFADAAFDGGVDYLWGADLDYRLVAADGIATIRRYRTHGFAATIQRYDRMASVLSPPDLVRFEILGAACWLIDAKALWQRALDVMQRDKRFFVDPA